MTMIIDCDVHPMLPDAGQSLTPYLTRAMQQRLAGRQTALSEPLPASRFAHPGGAVLRPDARPPSGGPPGSDPEFMRKEFLDPFGITAAILLPLQGAATSAWTNPVEAAALAAAYNDFFIEHWLSADERFNLAITVAPQDPVVAAEEVRRLAGTEGVVGVWVPFLDILLGHRHYHPIFDAAQEAGLPVVVHGCGTEGMYQGLPSFACGQPSTYAERYVDFFQFGIGHLASLIFEGVFERFPSLNFAFTEFGWTWIVPTLPKLDQAWQASRVEVPWVKRAPSEYVAERVRLTTQPLDDPPGHRGFTATMAELAGGGSILMFSSDYPHWDNDELTRVERLLPADMRERILFHNAQTLYNPRTTVAVSA